MKLIKVITIPLILISMFFFSCQSLDENEKIISDFIEENSNDPSEFELVEIENISFKTKHDLFERYLQNLQYDMTSDSSVLLRRQLDLLRYENKDYLKDMYDDALEDINQIHNEIEIKSREIDKLSINTYDDVDQIEIVYRVKFRGLNGLGNKILSTNYVVFDNINKKITHVDDTPQIGFSFVYTKSILEL